LEHAEASQLQRLVGRHTSAHVATDTHARRVDDREVYLLFSTRVLLCMRLAEEAVVFVDAEGTHDGGRARAVRAAPIEGIVASQEPHWSTAEATLPCAYDLTY
jgi:hypothetical protein